MNTFAFLTNPNTISKFSLFWPVKRAFNVSRIKKIRSTNGKETEGFLIFLPLSPQQILDLSNGLLSEKIISASEIAGRLGAGILGLGGQISLSANNNYKKIKLPMTSGNSLTAWSIFEAVYRTSRIKRVDFKNSCLTVIGASEPLGVLCAKKFSYCLPKIIINSKKREELYAIKENISNLNPIEVIIEEDVNKAIKDADIVINTGNSPDITFDTQNLKSGAIYGDIFSLRNSKPDFNAETTVINAGLIKLPFRGEIISAAMAETMLLALEGKFVNYSSGGDSNLDNLEEIADIAAKHGFEVWVPEAPVL